MLTAMTALNATQKRVLNAYLRSDLGLKVSLHRDRDRSVGGSVTAYSAGKPRKLTRQAGGFMAGLYDALGVFALVFQDPCNELRAQLFLSTWKGNGGSKRHLPAGFSMHTQDLVWDETNKLWARAVTETC